MNAALFQAVESGDLARVESLFLPPEVDVLNEYGSTPLLGAIRNRHKPIIECLLAHGAAVNGPVGAWRSPSRTPLQQVCSLSEARSDIACLLLEHGADVDAMTARERSTPLTLASCSNTKLSIVQLLINAGADVNGSGGDRAPLHYAAEFGNFEALELFIQSGADVNILSLSTQVNILSLTPMPAGSTPLHCASARDRSDYITTLLAAGAGPNIANELGQTPLHIAAEKSHLSSVNKLLAAGADPNIANELGQTPLHIAVAYPSNDVVKALLAAGSDPLHQDNEGRTPLQYLYERHNEEPFSAIQCNTITALVAAGDRPWECLPTPCPGLEAAMLSVWQAAPDEMPELLKRMENPPQNLIELFPRMDDAMKKVVQEVLRGLHHHYTGHGLSHFKEYLLKYTFDFKFEAAAAAAAAATAAAAAAAAAAAEEEYDQYFTSDEDDEW